MEGFAKRFRDRHPEWADVIDDVEADEHAALLTAHGLGVLNNLVLDAVDRSQVLDVIAEHSAGVTLIRRGFVDLAHEPSEMRRPVDLVGHHAGRRHAVEVKRLAASEHDDLHDRTMKALNDALEANKQPVAIWVELTDAFASDHINALVRHVKATLRSGATDGSFLFSPEDSWIARYKLYLSTKHQHARVIMLGDALGDDVDMREVTGVDQARVRHKVQAAYGKFAREPVDVTNLLVLQTDTVHLSAVGDALYGREHVDFHRGSDEMTVGRYRDGMFSRGKYSALHAVVIARRSERRLFAPFDLALFSNPGARMSADLVAQTLGASAVYWPSDFP